MALRVLITNDDGIYAPGIAHLVEWARKRFDVTVVAPKVEQSGKSQSINIQGPFEAKKVDVFDGIEAYCVDSSPADCVRYAICGMKKQFDLVLSGINRGLNIGEDVGYSGTLGACFEATLLGVRAVAFSTEPHSFNTAVAYLDKAWDIIESNGMLQMPAVFNVNIPETVKGIKITKQGGPYYLDYFDPTEQPDMVIAVGYSMYEGQDDFLYDTNAVLSGYLCITPLTVKRTEEEVFARIQHLNDTL